MSEVQRVTARRRSRAASNGGAATVATPQPTQAELMRPVRRHLLDVDDLSVDEITHLLDSAEGMLEVVQRDVRKTPALRGKVIVTAFFENSTRTRVSFEQAGKILGADVINVTVSASSVSKGESLYNTVLTLQAPQIDALVMRHPHSGAPYFVARHLDASVINAGDGAHAHPTQGLLDLFTVLEHSGSVDGKHVAIVGDIAHSRVARSDMWAFLRLGARVTLVGPPTLVPRSFRQLGVEISHSLDEVIPSVDVICLLRIQRERQEQGLFPSLEEYARLFGMTQARMKRAKDEVLVLHPGPMNRDIEITPEVADGPRSRVLDQVTNGLAVRMAALYLTAGGEE